MRFSPPRLSKLVSRSGLKDQARVGARALQSVSNSASTPAQFGAFGAPSQAQLRDLHAQLGHGLKLPPRASANFTNLQSLVEVLRQQLEPLEQGELHSDTHISHISELLKEVRINPQEWQQYATFRKGRYTRTLVGFDNKFVALLLCWERGQRSPIHDHSGASCWVKMLSGSLQEVKYQQGASGKLDEIGQEQFMKDDVSYMNDTLGLHQIINPSNDEPAVSLHIYSPPFRQCQIFQPVSGEAKTVSMVQPYAFQPAEEEDGLYPLFFKLPAPTDAVDHRPREQPAPKDTSSLTLLELVSSLRELNGAFETPFSSMTVVEDMDGEEEVRREQGLELLRQALSRLTLSQACLDRYCSPTHFSEFRYTRNLVYLNDQFSLMVLCWGPGQATPIHSLGKVAKSWFKVISGELQLEEFDGDGSSEANDTLMLTRKSGVLEGGGSLMRHRVSNPSAEAPAISVHVYSPPLKELYYKESGVDRISPVVNYGRIPDVELPVRPYGSSSEADTSVSVTARKATLPLHIPMNGDVFTNFDSFRKLLDHEFQRKSGRLTPQLEAKFTRMFKVMNFNPMEWKDSASLNDQHFTRVLLAQTEHYSLVLTCWAQEQFSPPHGHAGSKSWMKVLEGSVDEVQYEYQDPVDSSKGLSVSRSGSLSANSVTFLGGNTIHSCSNDSDEPAFTLHLYSPPYTCTECYQTETGQRTLIDIPMVYGSSMQELQDSTSSVGDCEDSSRTS